MEIKYQFFVEEKVFIQKFIGTFSVKDYMEYVSTVMVKAPIKADELNKIIIDFRDTLFLPPTEDNNTSEQMINLRKNIHNRNIKRDNVVHVFWVNDNAPKELFDMIAKRMDMSIFRCCTTILEINAYLGLTSDFGNIEIIADNLENSY